MVCNGVFKTEKGSNKIWAPGKLHGLTLSNSWPSQVPDLHYCPFSYLEERNSSHTCLGRRREPLSKLISNENISNRDAPLSAELLSDLQSHLNNGKLHRWTLKINLSHSYSIFKFITCCHIYNIIWFLWKPSEIGWAILLCPVHRWNYRFQRNNSSRSLSAKKQYKRN